MITSILLQVPIMETQLVLLEERDFAFQNRLQTFSIVNNGHIDVKPFFDDSYNLFETRVSQIIETHYIVKVGCCFSAVFKKVEITNEGEKIKYQNLYLHTRAEIVDFETNLKSFYEESIVGYVMEKIDDVELRGSGFKLDEIKELNIQVSKFDPFGGASFIELPEHLEKKRAIINVRNNDNQCFKYAVLSALYPAAKNAQRVTQYKKYENKLDFTGISFPIQLKDITKFEELNMTISINVYMYDQTSMTVRPLRLSQHPKFNHIHLLLLTETTSPDDNNENFDGFVEFDMINRVHEEVADLNMHYCWIKNLSALLSRQISKNGHRKIFCDRCLNNFTNIKKLETHRIDCFKQNDYQIIMPKEMTTVKFKDYNKKLRVPFVIYADVESLLKKPEIEFCKSEGTRAYQQHEAYSIGYYFKCAYDDSKSFYRSYRGLDCINWFVRQLTDIASDVEQILNEVVPLNMTLEDEAFFIISDECHICGKAYTESDVRVRDHCHLTGKYRGSAHADCNLNFQDTRHIPVIFHNLSNYDAHFIIGAVAKNIPGNTSIIPRNEESYISFTKTVTSVHSKEFSNFIKLRFIDSFQFMSSSLDYLSSILPTEKKTNLRSECKDLSNEKLKLLERKGIFCYDYVDSWSKLDEKSLPSKDKFYSELTESDVSDEDYEFASNVWNEFEIKSLGEYSDLYMKTDILLLADVFENFRDMCYDNYELDPVHYYTAPGLSFDAMLKYTNVNIELLTDVDMLLFVERGIRGGISQCSKRYSKANNKYTDEFDSNSESKFIVYLDANNLYGYSMMQCLPLDGFSWCDENFTAEDILQITDDSPTGYIFEVDLEYPQHLHDSHKDYPFCAEKRFVPNTSEKKLLLTLFDKNNYVIHYKMLKCALQHGLVLKKIHKILKFNQSKWLPPYIDLNTNLRMKASNEFEENYFKLLINAAYGKTMENVRIRSDIQLKTDWSGRYGVRKLIAMPNFKKYTMFDENLVAIHMNRTNILMDKPIAIGMSVLEISKVLMYDFLYEKLRSQYGENVELLCTDTDSFILEIKTDCFYKDMLENLSNYDTSDYSENNQFNIPRRNKKIPGLFKDEMKGEIITDFVGLRSKMYCVRSKGIENKKIKINEKKKAKGVKKYILKNSVDFDDYLNCIKNNWSIIRDQNTFRSNKHIVFSVNQTKVALSPLDNKRFILNGNIETLPWGHHKIPL